MAFAVERFAEKGYHTTAVSEIVDGLGVGKGVFYWYFDSKEELFREILREAHNDLRRTQQQALAGETDPVRRIELGLRASMRWWEEHRDLNTLIRVAANEKSFLRALRRGEEIAIADVAKHIKEAMAAGLVPEGDPELLAHAMYGASARITRTFIQDREQPAEDVVDACVRFCLQGLLGARV